MTLHSIQHVGFIGLGAMGKPIAVNLIKRLPQNITIHLFDVVEAPVDELCAQYPGRVVKKGSAKQTAESSNVIFTIVPEGQDVREVYLNKKTGICAADISGKILLGCSTIDTVTSLQVKDHISQSFPTALVYDTPISGGVSGAEAATLAIYVGIRDSDPNFTFLKELLLLIGKNIIPCGGPSLGLAVKLSNNYLAGVIVCLGVASRSKLERDQSTPD